MESSVAVARHAWIDVLLLALGVGALATQWFVVGAALCLLGVVLPLRRWNVGRQESVHRLARYVPVEIAEQHRRVGAASKLPGLAQPSAVLDAADHVLEEVAAVLAGRAARGGAQRRFVEVRVRYLAELAEELEARSAMWQDAMHDLDAVAPQDPAFEAVHNDRSGGLVTALMVVLSPLFVAWDVARGSVRAVVALVDGLVLRARAIGRLAVEIGQRWRAFRRRIVAAAKEARGQFVAYRVRLRLRLQWLRR